MIFHKVFCQFSLFSKNLADGGFTLTFLFLFFVSSTPCADKNTKCNYSAKKLRNQCDSENDDDDKKG